MILPRMMISPPVPFVVDTCFLILCQRFSLTIEFYTPVSFWCAAVFLYATCRSMAKYVVLNLYSHTLCFPNRHQNQDTIQIHLLCVFYLKHIKTRHVNILLIIFCSFLWILSSFLDTFVSNVCVPHSLVSILSFRFFVTVGSPDTVSMLSVRSCIGPFWFQIKRNLVCLYLLSRKNKPIYFWNCHNASLGTKAKLPKFS